MARNTLASNNLANETSALAVAELPSEDDYQAFIAVLSESTRGRAFLAEHAKRARQADTAMLLAAFERLEARVAAQVLAASPSPAPAEPPMREPAEAPPADIARAHQSTVIPEVMLFEGPEPAKEVPALEPAAISTPEVETAAETIVATPGDSLAAVMALSEDERIALFT